MLYSKFIFFICKNCVICILLQSKSNKTYIELKQVRLLDFIANNISSQYFTSLSLIFCLYNKVYWIVMGWGASWFTLSRGLIRPYIKNIWSTPTISIVNYFQQPIIQGFKAENYRCSENSSYSKFIKSSGNLVSF